MAEVVRLAGLVPMRERAGISQAELARRLGVSRQAVCIWESGEKWPTPDRLPQIAGILGCSIDELYTGRGAPHPPAAPAPSPQGEGDYTVNFTQEAET